MIELYKEDKLSIADGYDELLLVPNLHAWNKDLVKEFNDSKVLYLQVIGFEHDEGESYIQGLSLDLEEMKLLRDYLSHKIELMEVE